MTSIDELTMLFSQLSVSTAVEEEQQHDDDDMSIDNNENEPTIVDMELDIDDDDATEDMELDDTNEETVEPMELDDDTDDDMAMEIDTIECHDEIVAELISQFKDMAITSTVEALIRELSKMTVTTIDNEIDDKLCALFAELKIVHPDPVEELTFEFGNLSLSSSVVDPVWAAVGHDDDPMEIDDAMDLD